MALIARGGDTKKAVGRAESKTTIAINC